MTRNIKNGRIKFHYLTSGFSFTRRGLLKQHLVRLFKNEKTPLGSLDYIFCDDFYLLEINKEFLNHHDLTDIITFNLSDNDIAVGEIYISVDRVRENAIAFNKTFRDELSRVVFHGALHLCGYTDKTKADKTRMRLKEDEYIDYFNRQS